MVNTDRVPTATLAAPPTRTHIPVTKAELSANAARWSMAEFSVRGSVLHDSLDPGDGVVVVIALQPAPLSELGGYGTSWRTGGFASITS